MYTIAIDKNRNLSTTVRTTLLRNTQTDEIQFLYDAPEGSRIDSEEEPNPIVTYSYTAVLRYEYDGQEKSESLLTDAQLYKERVRFVLPRSSAFFNSRGMIQLWLDINVLITTTTKIYDDETGELIDEIVETETTGYATLPTTLFIDEVPHSKHCPRHGETNTIRITRGDSLTVNISLTDNEGFPYEPVEGDEVWFRVKKSAIAEDVLIEKSIDIENLVIDLVEADTKDLAFGNYVYEIEVVTTTNDHYTVIKNAPFIITEELH